MKLRIEAGADEYFLELLSRDDLVEYELSGASKRNGTLSIREASPSVFSILEGHRSFTIRVARQDDWLEAWVNGRRLRFRISDPRNRARAGRSLLASGPRELRALMPGKVVKLLVKEGDEVSAGTGLIVVEAMKMQNEMKSPKDGRVGRIHVGEGSAVGAGEALLVIE
ncbi:MAG: biotin/lipoyl-containing protein [Bryobacteraceae bacterium]